MLRRVQSELGHDGKEWGQPNGMAPLPTSGSTTQMSGCAGSHRPFLKSPQNSRSPSCW